MSTQVPFDVGSMKVYEHDVATRRRSAFDLAEWGVGAKVVTFIHT